MAPNFHALVRTCYGTVNYLIMHLVVLYICEFYRLNRIR